MIHLSKFIYWLTEAELSISLMIGVPLNSQFHVHISLLSAAALHTFQNVISVSSFPQGAPGLKGDKGDRVSQIAGSDVLRLIDNLTLLVRRK